MKPKPASPPRPPAPPRPGRRPPAPATQASAAPVIRVRGARQNNLQNLDLDLPLGRLVVVTGLSGSGKSSLAFDTLYAEGQRRYIETFSPYARQFLDRMDKPRVDRIEGIPPAIAIEQRNAVKTTRSTVGTLTEINDYARVLWLNLARLHCRRCAQPVQPESPQTIWATLGGQAASPGAAAPPPEVLVTFELPLSARMPQAESLELVARQGYQRLLVGTEIVRVAEAAALPGLAAATALTVVQDRLRLGPDQRARFVEACEQAYHFGHGRLAVRDVTALASPRLFSAWRHCAACDLEYAEPAPALFNFNHPAGACPVCRGFGRTINLDFNLALPDRSKTLAEGAVRPWQSGKSAECQQDLLKFCRRRRVPVDVPFEQMTPEHQNWVIQGDPGYGQDAAHEWPRAWYGIAGYFRWLEAKTYKMHVRVLLSKYRTYQTCPACQGARFQPDALLYKVAVPAADHAPARLLSLADFHGLTVHEARRVVRVLGAPRRAVSDALALALDEVEARLSYLDEAGLGYLTLDRPTRTLSGGETERVSLAACLGTRLVNTLFVLDEPTVGLHPRDTDRLIGILERLRDAGNTVLVVEHEARIMRAADQVLDLGPGHGESGGRLMFQGTCAQLLRRRDSITGQYLSGRKKVSRPSRNFDAPAPHLEIQHATCHNLVDLAVSLPLRRLVCVTGVSGSGKTTLIRDVLRPALEARLQSRQRRADQAGAKPAVAGGEEGAGETPEGGETAEAPEAMAGTCTLQGWDRVDRVVMVDQSSLGRTPRSNPAVYLGAFDDLRELFARTEGARRRGLNASAFSFNSAQGQCERCRGAGFEKIEMQFLSDVFVRCPDCQGRRYRDHILEVRLGEDTGVKAGAGWSIADLLEATADEVVAFLGRYGDSMHARRAAGRLERLREVGLGYVRLGQPLNTLSGGESQRLKLAEAVAAWDHGEGASATRPGPAASAGTTLFLFDEPTTGLHFHDVDVLLQALHRLVAAGHSVVVIEHNLELIRQADWVLDLGPEAGAGGGRLVAAGTPGDIAACPASHTGRALRE